jgi:hypothetical protein
LIHHSSCTVSCSVRDPTETYSITNYGAIENIRNIREISNVDNIITYEVDVTFFHYGIPSNGHWEIGTETYLQFYAAELGEWIPEFATSSYVSENKVMFSAGETSEPVPFQFRIYTTEPKDLASYQTPPTNNCEENCELLFTVLGCMDGPRNIGAIEIYQTSVGPFGPHTTPTASASYISIANPKTKESKKKNKQDDTSSSSTVSFSSSNIWLIPIIIAISVIIVIMIFAIVRYMRSNKHTQQQQGQNNENIKTVISMKDEDITIQIQTAQ